MALRRPSAWRVGGALAAIVALVGWLLVTRVPEDTHLWNALFDAGHAPLFGLVALLMLSIARGLDRRGRRSRIADYGFALVGALVLGVLTELAQFFVPRDSDPVDLLRNVAGAVAFLALFASFDPALAGGFARSRRGSALLRLLAVILLAVVVVPVVRVSAAYVQRNAAFPVICDFDAWWSRQFVSKRAAGLERVEPPNGWSHDGRVGRLVLNPARYPRLLIEQPYPDWTGYRVLRFGLFSPNDRPFKLGFRIHDRDHANVESDRYNLNLWVEPGVNEIEVPLAEVRAAPAGREMDMTAIRMIMLYAVSPAEPIEVFVGDFRLE